MYALINLCFEVFPHVKLLGIQDLTSLNHYILGMNIKRIKTRMCLYSYDVVSLIAQAPAVFQLVSSISMLSRDTGFGCQAISITSIDDGKPCLCYKLMPRVLEVSKSCLAGMYCCMSGLYHKDMDACILSGWQCKRYYSCREYIRILPPYLQY